MRFFLRLWVSLSIVICTPYGMAETIIIVTNNAHPITNVPREARIINLDRAEDLHEQLSVNLPKNPQQAVTTAKARLSTASADIQLALQDVVDAWALGITKVPAVVIDNRVVYGVSDIGRAVSLIKNHRESTQ